MVQLDKTRFNPGDVDADSPLSRSTSVGGTPCVGICSSGIGDTVCRGCLRFDHEVIRWNSYTPGEHEIILNRIESFLEKIIKNKIYLIDIKRLYEKSSLLDAKFGKYESPYRLVYELLRQKSDNIVNPIDYGFRLKPALRHESLAKVKDEIEMEWHILSRAHYDRYIAPGLKTPDQK